MPPGAGGRDVEQPPLLGQLRVAATADGRGVDAGHRVDELFGAEQRTAPAQVRPAALLHVRDARRGPTPGPCSACAVRMVTASGSAALGGSRVAGNLLRREVFDEPAERRRRAAGR